MLSLYVRLFFLVCLKAKYGRDNNNKSFTSKLFEMLYFSIFTKPKTSFNMKVWKILKATFRNQPANADLSYFINELI